MLDTLMRTSAPRAVILVRVLVGSVFLVEGIQKFLYPAELGAGRFSAIGIPLPWLTGPFVGLVETIGGVLVIGGLCTRLAAVPLVVDIAVALFTTKLPILFGTGFWGFALAKLPRYGFWSMVHEARTDWSMLLGGLFLVVVGGGGWSIDAWLTRRAPGRRA